MAFTVEDLVQMNIFHLIYKHIWHSWISLKPWIESTGTYLLIKYCKSLNRVFRMESNESSVPQSCSFSVLVYIIYMSDMIRKWQLKSHSNVTINSNLRLAWTRCK